MYTIRCNKCGIKFEVSPYRIKDAVDGEIECACGTYLKPEKSIHNMIQNVKYFPSELTDTLLVLTCQFGNYSYDPDCDGIVHCYEWIGFTAKSVSYERSFSGHGLYIHYGWNDLETSRIRSLKRFFIKYNTFVKRMKKFASFMKRMNLRIVAKHPEFIKYAWDFSINS